MFIYIYMYIHIYICTNTHVSILYYTPEESIPGRSTSKAEDTSISESRKEDNKKEDDKPRGKYLAHERKQLAHGGKYLAHDTVRCPGRRNSRGRAMRNTINVNSTFT
jgi:hypothetical protein